MSRMAKLGNATAMVALFGLAIWFRVSSLEGMPFTDGDEAYFGLQAQRLLAGEWCDLQTPTGNFVSPFNTGPLVLLLAVFPPSMDILRWPALACGLLTVVLTYRLGSRILDRPTALIASGIVATMPVAILFSRIGYDSSQTPLFSLLALYCAFRGRAVGLTLAMIACLYCHPVNILLVPIVMAVFLVRVAERTAGDPARQRRALALSAGLPLAIALAFGVYKLTRPVVRENCTTLLKDHNWPEYLSRLGRYFFGLCQFPLSDGAIRLHDWGFWIVVIGALVFGSVKLLKARQWDRMALIVGLVAAVIGFHLIGGRDVLRGFVSWYAYMRYGLFLVVPMALAMACLIRPLLVDPTTIGRALARQAQHGAILALGFAMLMSVYVNWFDRYRVTGETVWTCRTDVRDRFERALSEVRHDLVHRGVEAGRRTVISQGQWDFWPLKYLSSRDKAFEVVDVASFRDDDELIRRFAAGAYVAGDHDLVILGRVKGRFPSSAVRRLQGPFEVIRLDVPAVAGASSLGANRR